ncbi:RICIN domain-containing protein [Antribacter sp. KLBMP9083]|uniref:RICIN domain-containing protein n=1 Tax=Antribacter soli TaxID=2910976 RepID=A0AA41U7X9_9MICO|nr:glycoside hydrolase [Antribacter soli]MCF4122443.1 RICIN domain-containing protein [Antribacter soli]
MRTLFPWRPLGAAVVLGGLVAGLAGVVPPGSPPAAAAATDGPVPVTITPDPSYRASEPFQGWGTSLVWFANATGGYPDDVREELYQKVFGEDGLNLNIARYNVGGGNAVDVDDDAYMRKGGAVEGWWQSDLDGDGDTDEAVRANAEAYRAAWDADDAASYDLTADATQRWWVDRLVQDDQITHWEAFSNSPPWFMTENAYVTGGFNASTDQLRQDSIDDFAEYMVSVVEELEAAHGIEVDTIDPMNEPNTNYWGTSLNPDGSPRCCRQEGAHMSPALQAQVIEALDARLATAGSDARISAPDETNPGTFVADWNGWTPAARHAVDQLNVHTYGTSDRVRVRDIAKTADKPLWMSEVEGDFSGVDGLDLTNIDNGLGMAGRIVDDLRELEPSAWVFWQPVEDLWNMEVTETANWGSVYVDFDCDADGNSQRRLAAGYADPSCQVLTNAKYNTVRNFTHYINPGDVGVAVDDAATTAFVRGDETGATLVHVNSSTSEQEVALDLSRFAVTDGATVTPVVTTRPTADDPEANALVEGAPVAVGPDGTATLRVPAKSVVTFLVDGVSGVAGAAPADGTSYLLRGAGSGRVLTSHVGTGPALTIENLTATPGTGAPGTNPADLQAWTLHTLSGEGTNLRTVAVTDGAGRFLASTPGHGAALVTSDLGTAAGTPAQQWILNSLNGRTYSLLSVAATEQLDINGEGTAAGTGVGTWASSTGAHQAWTFQDTTLQGVGEVQAETPAGTAPSLPTTVEPRYAWGTGTPVPVVWDLPAAWDTAGTVTVTGTGTDVFGTAFQATALVDVGSFAITDPVTVHAYAGADLQAAVAAAPATVPAHVGTSPRTFDVPVVWDWSAAGEATATTGVVTLPGTATTRGGDLPATLSVVVTEPVTTNVATAPTTTASATYTEPGYPVDRTRNGVTNDKGWSNWLPGTLRSQDTLTYDLGAPQDLTAARIYFFADGWHPSWARAYTAEYRAADGTWVPLTDAPVQIPPASSGAPVAEVDLSGIRADAVRFVLLPTLRADGSNVHLVVSEVEIDAKGPGPSSVASLADLRVGGVPVSGWDPEREAYTVRVPAGADLPEVAAYPVDTEADVVVKQVPAVRGGSIARITVTSPDGSVTLVRSVRFVRLPASGTMGRLQPLVRAGPRPHPRRRRPGRHGGRPHRLARGRRRHSVVPDRGHCPQCGLRVTGHHRPAQAPLVSRRGWGPSSPRGGGPKRPCGTR